MNLVPCNKKTLLILTCHILLFFRLNLACSSEHMSCDGFSALIPDCCSSSLPCGINEGDCDNDDECHPNLKCGRNNCPANFPSTADCCFLENLKRKAILNV